MRLPHHGVEQAYFGTVTDDLLHPCFVHVPIVGTVKELVFRPADICAFHPVDFVQRVLVDSVSVASVFLLQTLYLNVLKAVCLRFVV